MKLESLLRQRVMNTKRGGDVDKSYQAKTTTPIPYTQMTSECYDETTKLEDRN